MAEIAFRPAVALAAEIRAKRLGSRELLDHYLDRINRLNPRLNAVVTLDAAAARARADAADAALARGEVWGPLHGLPMTIKDAFETAGIRTTCGAEVLREHVPLEDAAAVERLRRAGAVVFGKTNVPTFAMDLQTYNPIFGRTNNPWDTSRTPGGSSGGAAAALAAGLVGLELGSDIGGSIRTPAHYCGVYGLKPTWGIVPIRGHIPGPPGTLTEDDIGVAGPLARSADDLEAALDVLAGPTADRAVAWRLSLPPPRRAALREYRVAAWLDDPACPVDGEVRARLEGAADALRRAGVLVDDRARPGFDLGEAFRDYLRLLLSVTSAGLPADAYERLVAIGDGLPAEPEGLPAMFARFNTLRHREWLAAHERRERARARWHDFFTRYDALLCPITPVVAPVHDTESEFLERTIPVNGTRRPYVDQLIWAGVIGMAYVPAVVAPVGRTPGGLPVGVQIVGPYLEDRTPIDLARRLADVVGGFEVPPGFA
jgi:amidase